MNQGEMEFHTMGVRLDSEGNVESTRLSKCTLLEHIRFCLRAAVLTKVGERVQYPDLGSNAGESLFRSLTLNLKNELRSEICSSIEKSEPRVEILNVGLESKKDEPESLQIQLKYRVKALGRTDNYSFALIG